MPHRTAKRARDSGGRTLERERETQRPDGGDGWHEAAEHGRETARARPVWRRLPGRVDGRDTTRARPGGRRLGDGYQDGWTAGRRLGRETVGRRLGGRPENCWERDLNRERNQRAIGSEGRGAAQLS